MKTDPAGHTSENVLDETTDKIAAARSLTNRPFRDRMCPYPNIGSLLLERTTEVPEKLWLIYLADSGETRSYSYSEFFVASKRVAKVMCRRLGLVSGDRIATMMTNDARTVMVYFGAWILGLTVVPINCGEDDDRVAYILQNSEVKSVFLHNDQAKRWDALCKAVPQEVSAVVVGGSADDGFLDFDSEISSAEPLDELPDLSPETECLIVDTSGTTGPPKGVVLEHYNLLVDAQSIAEWHRFGPDDRAMCVLPIHHVNGTVVTLMAPLYSGGSVVLNQRFRAQTFWETLAREKCTWVSVVPTVLAFLCERADDLSQMDLGQFRHIICGAGPLTVELARKFDHTFGKRIVHGYGLSETTCYSCFLPIDLSPEQHDHWMTECGFPSIGCPISANEMAIHDGEGNALPPDSRGEIVIRGHNVMKYYFKRPDANKYTFAHGWFRSGDEGFYRVGEDGLSYFFITGRLKELIIRGGVNYSPFDIDEVLNAIPGIKAAMSVGFENDFYGEEVGAYVQREDEAGISDQDIISSCLKELPYSKCPKVVVFGETFPVTSTGKYQRNKLKPLFAGWKNVQFREEKKK